MNPEPATGQGIQTSGHIESDMDLGSICKYHVYIRKILNLLFIGKTIYERYNLVSKSVNRVKKK